MIAVFIGVLCIVIGFLIKRYPNLLAGYNTMSDSEKANVEIDKIANAARFSFILIGLIVIAVSILLRQLAYPWTVMLFLSFVPVFIGYMIFVGYIQRYDHNK